MSIKKYLAVTVILLFIGVAFAPCIHANISKEMVEFTTEICGLNGGKQTVKLTKEQAGEVEALFDSIRERLNLTETREEAEEIFNEAVVELDKYGLLGGLSVKQAQRLVIGSYQNSRVIKLLERLCSRKPTTMGVYENKYCLIAGRTNNTISYGFIWWLLSYLLLVRFDRIGADFVFSIMGMISNFNPFAIFHAIGFGYEERFLLYPSYYVAADGWVWTYGENGKWIKETPIWGRLPELPLFFFPTYFCFFTLEL